MAGNYRTRSESNSGDDLRLAKISRPKEAGETLASRGTNMGNEKGGDWRVPLKRAHAFQRERSESDGDGVLVLEGPSGPCVAYEGVNLQTRPEFRLK